MARVDHFHGQCSAMSQTLWSVYTRSKDVHQYKTTAHSIYSTNSRLRYQHASTKVSRAGNTATRGIVCTENLKQYQRISCTISWEDPLIFVQICKNTPQVIKCITSAKHQFLLESFTGLEIGSKKCSPIHANRCIICAHAYNETTRWCHPQTRWHT